MTTTTHYTSFECNRCKKHFLEGEDLEGHADLCGTDGYTEREHTFVDDSSDWEDTTREVLERVLEERRNQVRRYGFNQDLFDGFGPGGMPWADPYHGAGIFRSNKETEELFRRGYERWGEKHGKPTWMHLIREEMAEFFAEDPDSPEAIAEAIQVAALLVSWVEKKVGR